MIRYRIFLFLMLLSVSCKKVDNPKMQFLKWATTGAIIDNVVCKNDPNQSYSVYLPTNYDVSKNYPTIYAFDPHGKGRIPVVLIKNIAERLGYIVIGSNNSRNGLRSEDINSIVNSLFTDSQMKLAIDPQRIYLLGFSGGARVACMIGQRYSEIKGVIACSAGFQPKGNSLSFRFIGIAGNQDMNYLEMKRLNDFLESIHIPNQFIVFNGKHQWPSEAIMTEAIAMLELYAMQDSFTPKSRSIEDEYLSKNQNRIETLIEGNCPDSLALAYTIAKRTYQVLYGLANVENLKKTISELNSKPILQQYSKDKALLENYELQKQKEFSESFGSKPEAWWNKEIELLYHEDSGLKGDISKRLLGYISLSCYGYVNGALSYQDWKAVQYFSSIYIKVDPEIPESWYALACLQANAGKPEEAIESLKKAIKYGFSDFAKITHDPLLITLRGLPEFSEVLKK